MEQKELQEFLYFFTHNKSLTRAQQFKRDALLARDFVKNSGKSDGLPEIYLENNISIQVKSPVLSDCAYFTD